LKDCELTIADNAAANSIVVKMGEGNLTWTENTEVEYLLDRGIIDTVRLGNQVPMDVSFEGRFTAITAYAGAPADDPTLIEALTNSGAASAWVSTGGACEPYAVDLIIECDRTCTSGTDMDEIITFSDFRQESIGGDFQAGQISVSGKCNVQRPTSIRTTL